MRYNKNPFSAFEQKKVQKSRFHMPHTWNHDFAIGKVIPIMAMPTMPGDDFEVESEFLFKFLPMHYPTFGMLNMEANYYWVPNRLCWRTTKFTDSLGSGDGWEAFITFAKELEHPVINPEMQLFNDGQANDCVLGYMNLPYILENVDYNNNYSGINAIPLSAYLLIVDTYVRNDKLEKGRWFNLEEGDNTTAFNVAFAGYQGGGAFPIVGRYRVLSSKWEWDYFTSCTPSPQMGDPIKIPSLGIDENGDYIKQDIRLLDGTVPVNAGLQSTGGELMASAQSVVLETNAIMQQLREAEVAQSFRERLNKVGQRFGDYLKGFFGKSPLAGSIDLPLWFGNYSAKVEISETFRTADTVVNESTFAAGQQVGNLSMYKRGGKLVMNCSDHGWIIATMEIRPTASYGQGVERWWRYKLPTDYPMDMFANIGDQEVLKEELMYNNKNVTQAIAGNNATFGYIERYAEMKFMQSRYGTNLLPYTHQLWSKSVHDGRFWNAGIMDDQARYDETISISNWITDVIRHVGDETWPTYTGENGQYRDSDFFQLLTLPFGLGSTSNPVIGLIYHDVWINRQLPFHSTPKLGVQ